MNSEYHALYSSDVYSIQLFVEEGYRTTCNSAFKYALSELVALTNNREASECAEHEVGTAIIDARFHMVEGTVEIVRTYAL